MTVASGRRAAMGVALAVAGGWFAPLLWMVYPSALNTPMLVIGGVLVASGVAVAATDRGRPALSIATAAGASIAVSAGYASFWLIFFGPIVFVVPIVLITALVLFALRSPTASHRIPSVLVALGGAALIVAAGVLCGLEAFIWYVDAFLPDRDVAETLQVLRPDEQESVARAALTWPIPVGVVASAFAAYSVIVIVRRRAGIRRVGALALGSAALVGVAVNFWSFTVGWNLTDYLRPPEDYYGFAIRMYLVSALLSAASLLAFWPVRAPGDNPVASGGDSANESAPGVDDLACAR